MSAVGGAFGAAALSKGVIAFGGGFAAGFPVAFAGGDGALGILLTDFATGAAFTFGPAEEERGDLSGIALFFAPPCAVERPFLLLLEPG